MNETFLFLTLPLQTSAREGIADVGNEEDKLTDYCPWQNIKENIEGHAVDWYGDVYDIIFPDVNPDEANNQWKEQLKEPEGHKKDRDAELETTDE